MTDNTDKINNLLYKLESLLKRQDEFSREVNNLRIELNRLKIFEQKPVFENEASKPEVPKIETSFNIKNEDTSFNVKSFPNKIKQEQNRPNVQQINNPPEGKSDIEKFIGENLINKIGIAITIIGVAIGAKYSIENNLISPLTRIIIGYLFGLGLLGFGIKLKSKYENYSAVLVSGAMAIMYLITYLAYDLYSLIPQIMAFILMLIFTAFTVIAALNYNRQVIALIGLVGAYAVPFLLSDGSGKVVVLFSYMSIINIGIVAIAIKKYWKPLYCTSFGLTWLIFFSWYISKYQITEHFGLALIFLSIFFSIFYLTFLAYKLLQKEKFVVEDIVLLMVNSFVYYGIGYAILNNHSTGEQLLGLFTLFNAFVHFIVSVVMYKQKLIDKNIQYLITGLVLIFITIAIPVQLNGNWVTLLWAGQAALLFWIGRTKNVAFYEKISYLLMLLGFFSLSQDWLYNYNSYIPESPETRIRPLLNVNFFTSICFIAAFGFITHLNQNKNYTSALEPKKALFKIISYSIPGILIFTIYYAFRIEIDNYWSQLFQDSAIVVKTKNQSYPNFYNNYNLNSFKAIWIINYSLLFVSILSFWNIKKFKHQLIGFINLGLIILAISVFLIQGLYVLSELREAYLNQPLAQYYKTGVFNLWIRYISFAFVALALVACFKYTGQDFIDKNFKIPFQILLHISTLWVASSELINWMDISQSTQSYKLGLSILWGTYSLFLIAFGIWKNSKPLRVGAIGLFGITLIKLFFYDISHLNTISKTIVFVSLGILLLIISFLYNKYKHLISDNETYN